MDADLDIDDFLFWDVNGTLRVSNFLFFSFLLSLIGMTCHILLMLR